MLLEVFIHIAHLDDLFSGRPVNCKINYASQYDIKLLLDPRKYVLVSNGNSNNLVTIRKKKFRDRFKKRKHIK